MECWRAMDYLNSISRRTLNCQNAFKICLSNPTLFMLDWIENRQADFNLWASSIKAASSGKSSLDYRVRERPDVSENICHLLDGLLEALEYLREREAAESFSLDAEENQNPHTDTLEEYDAESSEASSLNSLAEHTFAEEKYHIQTILHQLAKISTAIRKSGSKYRFAKADATLREENHTDFKEHLVALIRISQIQAAQKCSQDYIDELQSSTSKYEALTIVQRRLVRANVNRRNRIKYATRNMQLKNESFMRKEEAPGPRDITLKQPSAPVPKELPKDHSTESLKAKTKSIATSSANKTKSIGATVTATSLGSDFVLQEVTPPAADSVITRATLTATALEYPRCPKPTRDNLLQCPCCGDLLSSEYYKQELKWRFVPDPRPLTRFNCALTYHPNKRSHVAHDLLPYTCIFEQCNSADEMFTTSEDLVNHMLQEHGTVFWVCNYCTNDTERFAFESSLEWEQHMVLAHSNLLPQAQLPLFADFSRQTLIQSLSCPICDFNSEDTPTVGLDSHVLQHLHDFALTSLPWELGDDKNTASQATGLVSGALSSQLSSRNIASTEAEEKDTSETRGLSAFLSTEVAPLLSKAATSFTPALSIMEEISRTIQSEADGADELPQDRYDRLELFANKVHHILTQFLTELQERPENAEDYFYYTTDDLVVELDLLSQSHIHVVADEEPLQSVPAGDLSLYDELSFRGERLSLSPQCESLQNSLDFNNSNRKLLYQGELSEVSARPGEARTIRALLLDNYFLLLAKGHRYNSEFPYQSDLLVVGMEGEEQHSDWVVTLAAPVSLLSITRSNLDVVIRRYLDAKPRRFRPRSSLAPNPVSSLLAIFERQRQELRRRNPFFLHIRASNVVPTELVGSLEKTGVRARYTRTEQNWQYTHNMSRTISKAQCALSVPRGVTLVGTAKELWSIRSNAKSSGVKKVLGIEVKHIALMEEKQGVLILSDQSLNHYSLHDILQFKDKVRYGRVATGVDWFTVVHNGDRTLIYCLSDGSTSTDNTISVFDADSCVPAYTVEPRNMLSLLRRLWTPTNAASGGTADLHLPEPLSKYSALCSCSSLTIVDDQIFMLTPVGFKTFSADKASSISVPTQRHSLSQSLTTKSESQLAIAILPWGKSEVILVYERFAAYMDLGGVVSRTIDFVYGSYPVQKASLSDSFLVLFTERYVEIRNAGDGKLRQIIPGHSIKCLDEGLSDGTTTTGFHSVKGTIKFAIGAVDNPKVRAIVELVADQ